MLLYDRIDVSEGIDVHKASNSKECDIYHCLYFFRKKSLVLNYVPAMVVMMC